jgi:hypothetical protein
LPLCRLPRRSGRGSPHQCKPPTRSPRATLASGRTRTARFSLFNASSRSLNRPRICCGTTPAARSSLEATKSLSPTAVAAGGAVTQTLSGERPAGLRTTRAELLKAKPTLPSRQGLVWGP